MNHSIYSADRMTHVKVVVIALVAGIGVAGFGIAARINAGDRYAQTAHILKAKVPLQDRKFALALPRPECSNEDSVARRSASDGTPNVLVLT